MQVLERMKLNIIYMFYLYFFALKNQFRFPPLQKPRTRYVPVPFTKPFANQSFRRLLRMRQNTPSCQQLSLGYKQGGA